MFIVEISLIAKIYVFCTVHCDTIM